MNYTQIISMFFLRSLVIIFHMILGTLAFFAHTVFQSEFTTLIYIAPFAITTILAFYVLAVEESGKRSIQLIAAALSAFTVLIMVSESFQYAVQVSRGDFNFGMAFLLFSIPVILPVVMVITGLVIGLIIDKIKSSSAN